VAYLAAARADEAPRARLALAQRLPGRDVRTVAQIFERELAVVIVLVVCEVVEGRRGEGLLGVVVAPFAYDGVAAIAERCAECIRVVG